MTQRSTGTDLRVMSWNILSEELTPTATAIESRMDGICQWLLQYDADLLGVQEISEAAYAMFEEKLGEEYAFVNPKTKEENFSYTGVAYHKKRFALLESDIENFELGNRRIRVMNWIYVEEKQTGRRFVLLSTHWDRHACNRVPDAVQMSERVKELAERFGCPILCVGDYNAKESTAAYKTFMSRSGYGDAKYLCDEPVNNIFTGHPLGVYEPEFEGTECIDHIIMSNDFEVLHYEAIRNTEVIHLSDHLPIYADLKMK